jgi:hypothetical protein
MEAGGPGRRVEDAAPMTKRPTLESLTRGFVLTERSPREPTPALFLGELRPTQQAVLARMLKMEATKKSTCYNTNGTSDIFPGDQKCVSTLACLRRLSRSAKPW